MTDKPLLPQKGGSFVREDDGSLKPAQTTPAAPVKKAAKPAEKEA